MYRIGIDVGGTNTDAVLMRDGQVVQAVKAPTSADVTGGVLQALRDLVQGAGVEYASLRAVMIGTTHFTNALVERQHLAPVGMIRLARPASTGIPPLSGWPEDLLAAGRLDCRIAGGGYEFDGAVLAPVQGEEIRAIAAEFAAAGIRNIAISGVFSSINDAQEREAAAHVLAVLPQARVTLSSEIGRVGLLDRENAAILNAALGDLGEKTINALRAALREAGVEAPFYITQNDGTLMDAERAARFPILTVASGPTNSMRGAAFLSGCKDAIVVDIGGTTSDVGVLVNGFPRQTGTAVEVGGVRTNFRMPDVYSLGLGGGTLVADDYQTIGPHSVGFRLRSEALVFGGRTLTATDIAVAAAGGIDGIGDPALVADLDPARVAACLARMRCMILAAIDRMRTSDQPLPVLVVGGGSVLLHGTLGQFELRLPPHFAVANAVGAAMAQVSGEADRVLRLADIGRDAAIAQVRAEAQQKALEAGATADSLELVDIEDVPLAYMPGDATRIRVRVVGNLQTTS
ncbi:hydantoinase/oxoprolinase N-terminal domain-containing protein [Duganella aceris]|uniref:Hydantoinase/oxoprolinase family protein n=1 Tax=Duganella aceris TaxID=2703883 RepID=A0ABX0FKV5_9BURK|nr:hydantoinase/oxoprolinase family protein [Duganella aceris]NGZ85160.1 hydantoinase/oxoprolinase family protein [Duganella aceris]